MGDGGPARNGGVRTQRRGGDESEEGGSEVSAKGEQTRGADGRASEGLWAARGAQLRWVEGERKRDARACGRLGGCMRGGFHFATMKSMEAMAVTRA